MECIICKAQWGEHHNKIKKKNLAAGLNQILVAKIHPVHRCTGGW